MRKYTIPKILILVMTTHLNYAQGQFSKPPLLVDHLSIGLSFNAVADEAVLGVRIAGSKTVYSWKNGNFYTGGAMYYGLFPNTVKKINRYMNGTTSMWHPLQVVVGHRFHVLKRGVLIRTALNAGLAYFRQHIQLKDDRYDLDETYTFSKMYTTMHAQVGLGTRLGQKYDLELYVNLPMVNPKLALTGIGIAVNRKF